jgi:hypothetical protein
VRKPFLGRRRSRMAVLHSHLLSAQGGGRPEGARTPRTPPHGTVLARHRGGKTPKSLRIALPWPYPAPASLMRAACREGTHGTAAPEAGTPALRASRAGEGGRPGRRPAQVNVGGGQGQGQISPVPQAPKRPFWCLFSCDFRCLGRELAHLIPLELSRIARARAHLAHKTTRPYTRQRRGVPLNFQFFQKNRGLRPKNPRSPGKNQKSTLGT